MAITFSLLESVSSQDERIDVDEAVRVQGTCSLFSQIASTDAARTVHATLFLVENVVAIALPFSLSLRGGEWRMVAKEHSMSPPAEKGPLHF